MSSCIWTWSCSRNFLTCFTFRIRHLHPHHTKRNWRPTQCGTSLTPSGMMSMRPRHGQVAVQNSRGDVELLVGTPNIWNLSSPELLQNGIVDKVNSKKKNRQRGFEVCPPPSQWVKQPTRCNSQDPKVEELHLERKTYAPLGIFSVARFCFKHWNLLWPELQKQKKS